MSRPATSGPAAATTVRTLALVCLCSLTAIAGVAVAPSLVHAQGAPALLGSWSITYERGRRIENDQVTKVMGEGRLQLAESGDSLLATLAAGPRPDGSVPPPAVFGGRVAGDSAVFTQKQSVRININGEESTRDIVLTWVLRAKGDALTGTLSRAMPDMAEPPEPSPVTGTRQR